MSPEDVGFAQLGEGESFRLPDGGFKFFSRESRAESQVVRAAQVEELNREFIPGRKQRQTKIARTNAEFEMVADDSRIYVAIKEPTDAMFPRTPCVLTNSGGDLVHRVKLEMPWKLKARNVSFAMVETIPAGENRESLPTIGEEGLTSKHDIFYWRLQVAKTSNRKVRRFLTAKAIRDCNDADVLPEQTHA